MTLAPLRRFLFLLAFVVSCTLGLAGLSASPAFALDLDTAKAQGLVGERPDGLLGIVGVTTAEVDTLIEDVNARRMDLFRKIAADKGQAMSTVQAISGEEFIARTRKGHFIMDGNGAWVRKQ